MISPRVPDADPVSRVVVTMLSALLGLTLLAYAGVALLLAGYVGGSAGLAVGTAIVLVSCALALVALRRSRRRWQRRTTNT
jgi:membrane protein implicated in regulation of membrane protease activity